MWWDGVDGYSFNSATTLRNSRQHSIYCLFDRDEVIFLGHAECSLQYKLLALHAEAVNERTSEVSFFCPEFANTPRARVRRPLSVFQRVTLGTDVQKQFDGRSVTGDFGTAEILPHLAGAVFDVPDRYVAAFAFMRFGDHKKPPKGTWGQTIPARKLRSQESSGIPRLIIRMPNNAPVQ